MIYSLLLSEKYLRSPRAGQYVLPDAATWEDVKRENAEVAEVLDPRRLRELKLLRLDRIAMPDQFSERMRGMRGIDEIAEFLLLYEFNGRQYRGTAAAYRFGGDWCLGALNSLAAMRLDDFGVGMLLPVSPEEYEAQVAKFADDRIGVGP